MDRERVITALHALKRLGLIETPIGLEWRGYFDTMADAFIASRPDDYVEPENKIQLRVDVYKFLYNSELDELASVSIIVNRTSCSNCGSSRLTNSCSDFIGDWDKVGDD